MALLQELASIVPLSQNDTTMNRLTELIMLGADPNARAASSTVLHMAAQRGDIFVVTLLIEAGADIHAEDDYGSTPLQDAAAFARPDVARLLVALGADAEHKSDDGRRPVDDICLFVACDAAQVVQMRSILG